MHRMPPKAICLFGKIGVRQLRGGRVFQVCIQNGPGKLFLLLILWYSLLSRLACGFFRSSVQSHRVCKLLFIDSSPWFTFLGVCRRENSFVHMS